MHAVDRGQAMVSEVARLWAGLGLFPLEMIAACEGKSTGSFLAEATGLSPAHLSSSGLEVKNQKRLGRVRQHAQEYARSGLAAKGYSPDEIEQYIAAYPETALAGLAYRLGHAGPAPLSLAMSLGARLDRLVLDVLRCVENDELSAYQCLLIDFLDEEKHFVEDQKYTADIAEIRRALSAATDWASLQGPSDAVVQHVLLAVLAAVDVEWGARYFGSLAPTPTFLWLAPQFHPDFDASNSKGMKRNVVTRPVSKLFDLLWAVTKRGTSRHARWPAKSPSPPMLAADIGHESTGDGVIRKWTNGAKPIRLDQVAELWASLTANLSGGTTFEVPFPWIAVALWMERALVKRSSKPNSSKPGTVIFLSDIAYQAIWAGHRKRWADELPEPGNLPWPEWLLAQSSWPDWMRSSQSSGRPSSPRDCQ